MRMLRILREAPQRSNTIFSYNKFELSRSRDEDCNTGILRLRMINHIADQFTHGSD